jgi:hypothetical protein
LSTFEVDYSHRLVLEQESDMPKAATDDDSGPPGINTSAAMQAVTEALGRLKYGAINLTVHEGRLVQIDVTERQRFSSQGTFKDR